MIDAINANQQAMLSKLSTSQVVTANPQSGGVKDVSFSDVFLQAIGSVNEKQIASSRQAEAVELGHSDDLVAAMVLNQKASISFTALVEVRNKLVGAFDDILKMPV